MPTSQNVKFKAVVPKDEEFAHPAGAALMRRISADLATGGWIIGEMDNWRDCGWSATCHKGAAELEVVVSQIQEGQWILQISPERVPGLLGRLFGGKPSAMAQDVHDLALAVNRALSTLQTLGSPCWRWDGFPDDDHSTPEPQAPASP